MRNALAVLAVLSCASGVAQAQKGQKPDLGGPGASIAGTENSAMLRSARASKVIGSKVFNGDTAVGQIEDVLVDFNRSAVPAIILSVGGFLHLGDKLVAVPANQIEVGREAKFTTGLTRDQLANAPAFEFGKLQ